MVRAETERLLRHDWPVWRRHGTVTAYAARLGMTVPALKRALEEVEHSDRVSWRNVTDETLELVLNAVESSREPVNRVASRFGYSPGPMTKALAERFPDKWRLAQAKKLTEQSKNKYQLGANLERRIMRKLESLGFVVIRSAGSHSFVDVVALKDGQAMLIQAKRGGVLPLDEWNGLVEAAMRAGAHPVMVENPHRGEVRWWRLEGPRERGESGAKSPIEVPKKAADMSVETTTTEMS